MKHESVLLEESIKALNLSEDSIVIDATLGLGGHSKKILEIINKGHLYCFEQDEEAIKLAKKNLKQFNNFTIIHDNFVNMKKSLLKINIHEVNAILFDLGVSSLQLDDFQRGFSFHHDAFLDMRMNLKNEKTAYDVINNYSLEDLVAIFFNYGEEKYSRKIAQNIVDYRIDQDIKTTGELVKIIQMSVPEKYKREKHPARRIFQAIRIEVNDELKVFERALQDSLDLVALNGRIVVITFHSLEDRICQNVFKKVSKLDKKLQQMPFVPDDLQPKFKSFRKIMPTLKEINKNKRARSACLRMIERIK